MLINHLRWIVASFMAFFAGEMDATGYSYARFVGPVQGPEHKVIIQDTTNGGVSTVDYFARPEYQFAYGVEDVKTGVLQNHREARTGDAVKGAYSLVDPDGMLRVVKYSADDVNGFQAEVIKNGLSTFHGHNPVASVNYQNQNAANMLANGQTLGNNQQPLKYLFHHTKPATASEEKSDDEDDYDYYDGNSDDNDDENSKEIDGHDDDSDATAEDTDDGNKYEYDEE